MNIGLTLSRNANRTPDKTAIIFEEESISYQTLNQEVNKLAHGMMKQGFQKGDHIAMMQMNTEKFVICYYAIMKIGAVAVPLNVRLTSNEVAYILEDSDSIAIFYDDVFELLRLLGMLSNKRSRVSILNFTTSFFDFVILFYAYTKYSHKCVILIIKSMLLYIFNTSLCMGNSKRSFINHHLILPVANIFF